MHNNEELFTYTCIHLHTHVTCAVNSTLSPSEFNHFFPPESNQCRPSNLLIIIIIILLAGCCTTCRIICWRTQQKGAFAQSLFCVRAQISRIAFRAWQATDAYGQLIFHADSADWALLLAAERTARMPYTAPQLMRI